MISIRQEPLPEPKQVALKSHLSGEGYALLTMVISNRATTELFNAMTPALESKDHDARLAVSNEFLREAHKYKIALDVLHELKEQQEPFTTAKLS